MAGAGMHPYHQQWVPPPQPPPPAAPPMPVENPNRTTADEVRTIFISGLPGDVKERELHNLLRWLPGFEASQINFKAEQPMGFALFSTPQHAMAAKNALQDLVFDAETKSVLHTEMAKKNLFVKRAEMQLHFWKKIGYWSNDSMVKGDGILVVQKHYPGVVADSNSIDQSKRLRTGGDYTHTGYPAPPFHPPPPPPVWGNPGSEALLNQRSYLLPTDHHSTWKVWKDNENPDEFLSIDVVLKIRKLAIRVRVIIARNTKDNPPCNTLFIGNLGENVNEEELRGLFSVQPGYKQMKILRQERNTVCFIEFDDLNSATTVHQNLQGAVLPSSGRGGMRIQYPFS
ncbi:RNA-binding protein with multiple splicing 2 [Cocos nucifera]|uniref:RNA-binding protein with multiple splicing 2 n=1 Tax=Cocos nucifera TaxID=13894 RepID=A0A8K0HUJ9_COCNU|nr:RNA-binding protein with multiple splicing 2 [Cocos nucifera]